MPHAEYAAPIYHSTNTIRLIPQIGINSISRGHSSLLLRPQMKSCEVFESREQRSINAFLCQYFATPRTDINPIRRDDKSTLLRVHHPSSRRRQTICSRKIGYKITQNNSFVQIFGTKFLKFLTIGDDLRGLEAADGTKT